MNLMYGQITKNNGVNNIKKNPCTYENPRDGITEFVNVNG